MKALLCKEFGPPASLVVEEVPAVRVPGAMLADRALPLTVIGVPCPVPGSAPSYHSAERS